MSRFGLHSGYFHPVLRSWQCDNDHGDSYLDRLMLPLFVLDDPDGDEAVGSMPGVRRMGVNTTVEFLRPLVEKGLRAVLLFSVTSMEKVRIRAQFYCCM